MSIPGDDPPAASPVGLDSALRALRPYGDVLKFSAGDRIFDEATPSDSFFFIEEGEVSIEVHAREIETDCVLAHSGPGSFLGEVGVLAGEPRSASAVAQTTVVVRRFSRDSLDRLAAHDPPAAMSVVWALGRDAAGKLVRSSERVAEFMVADSPDPEIDRVVASAVAAQKEFESWSEPAVDALLADIAKTVAAHAEDLATTALTETGIGNIPDKVLKIRFGSLGVQSAIVGKTGRGPVSGRRDPLTHQQLRVGVGARVLLQMIRHRPSVMRSLPKLISRPGAKVEEFVCPLGVVFALVPLTEPVATFVDGVLITLKGRNAIIVSSHRLAQGVTDDTGRLIREVLTRRGAPPDLVQWVQGRKSRQTTARFMSHADVALILATGGGAMVKAAYSSGKPAIGVGPGNAPAWIAADADVSAAAYFVLESKTFDYGLVCGSEQHLVVDRSVLQRFEAALLERGAFILDDAQTEPFLAAAFDPVTTDLRVEFVGKSAVAIAEAVGLEVPPATRLLVFRADAERPEGSAARERLAPVVSLFSVDGEEAAVDLCCRILNYEGAGHTAVVHTSDRDRARRFAECVPASRVLVNAPATQGCCGVMSGLFPSLTLGCGSFGGNSTTDNVGFANLVNIKRMAGLHLTGPATLAALKPSTMADVLREMP